MFLRHYLRNKKLKLDIEIQQYKESLFAQKEEMALLVAKQLGEYEHTFHSTHEMLGIELAKLEARKLALENELKVGEDRLADKNKEIERLTTICNKLAENKQVVVAR